MTRMITLMIRMIDTNDTNDITSDMTYDITSAIIDMALT